ncbi:hypothetical protein L5515_004399 [Caenorhabditis briggsae]|uniref:Uncharacterized protein n=1 Tax=Caenorhabditis briggsae TaxID=6238 RepID=A0AAE9EMK3_CAEBR|nr:hypothetical protein L5515_004399 [Caenorhabditis briggsae]
MPKQDFSYQDMLGVVAVWCSFFVIIGIITVTCVNFYCIHDHDDVTVLEKVSATLWGRRKRLGVRLGVHNRATIDEQIALKKFKSDLKD